MARPGRWKKGESGNPKGRTPGVGAIAKVRAEIAKHVPEIVAKLVERAREGDSAAARLLLERAVPPIKPIELPAPIALPDGSTLTEQGRAVLSAAGLGDITPGQAAQLLASLSALAKLIETDELAARITRLEERRENA